MTARLESSTTTPPGHEAPMVRSGARVRDAARPPRRRRWLTAIGFVVLLILSTGFAVVRVELEGPALADKISTTLNKRMRGRISIGSIEWDVASLKNALTG